MTANPVSQLDVRTLEPSQRHAQIFARLDALRDGESMQIINDHDPKPLRYQLEARWPGLFQWTYVESGPQEWRVNVGKDSAKAKVHGEDSCCSGGACSGG